MLTLREAKDLALNKYIELWGEDWFNAHAHSIGDSIGRESRNVYVYSIDQCEVAMTRVKTPPPKTAEEFIKAMSNLGPEVPPDHVTTFLIDLEKGTVEVTDHY